MSEETPQLARLPARDLPQLTHLQIAVMECLGSSKTSGKDLRETLVKFSVRKSAPAFYQLMSRLEKSGFVRGWYENTTVGDQIVRERMYEMTGAGHIAAAEAREFYANLTSAGILGGMLSYGH